MASSSVPSIRVRTTPAPRVSVVVPALNEARRLEVLLPELIATVDCHQVILVDGGSVDDTVATARRVLPTVTVLHQVRRGKGNALAAGFAAVSGDIVVMLDVAAGVSEIPGLIAALRGGADVARSTRYGAGGAYWVDLVKVLDLPDHRIIAPVAGQCLWGDSTEIDIVIARRFAAAGLDIAIVPPTTERPAIDAVTLLKVCVVEWTRALLVRRAARRQDHPALRAARARAEAAAHRSARLAV